MEVHIFTMGEQKLRDTAQQDLSAAGNLLNEPLKTNDVHDALRKARAATAALEYLDGMARGCPAPRRGDG